MQLLKKARRTAGKIKRSTHVAGKITYISNLMQDGTDSVKRALSNSVSDIPAVLVKPLTKIADYPEKAQVTDASIQAWRKTTAFMDVRKYFQNYPSRSLIADSGREILYYLIRSLKPKYAIEVGSYYAGTAEVIARALWENDEGGILYTTDPFGAERCPVIISRWPVDLQKHVQYHPLNSMEFFAMLERRHIKPDFAFIDGNHDYEYAYFDLLSAAKMITPGGIVIMDNVEQPGPFWASVDFLRLNPEWTEIGSIISDFSGDRPFDDKRCVISGDSNSFLILKAPDDYVVKSALIATGQQPYAEKQLSGIRMEMSKPASAGVLHMQIFLRGFSHGRAPDQLITTAEIKLEGGESSYALTLPKVLQTEVSTMNVEHHHTVEIVMYWQPTKPGETLRLKTAPQPVSE